MSSTQQAEAPPHRPLLGDLVITPPNEEAEAVIARLAQWESALKPWDLYESWLLQDIARETIRLERLHQREIAVRHELATCAVISWDEDRTNAAEALAENLSRRPARTLAELRRSTHGCDLVARRWETLLATLDKRGAWSARERLLALNLLNVPPELREAVTPLDAPDGDDPVAHLRSVAAAQIRRHRDLAATLAPIDVMRREALRLGLGPDTPALASIRKEERASSRLLAWCRSQFKTSRRDARPPDSDNRPPYKFQPSDLPYQSDEADAEADDLPPLRKSDGSLWPAPQSTATPSLPDPSDPSSPPRASPAAKSRRRRRA